MNIFRSYSNFKFNRIEKQIYQNLFQAMKIISQVTLFFLCLSSPLYSKSRLGEYFLGFGAFRAGGGDVVEVKGDSLNLSANSPASDFADFALSFNYGNLEVNATEHSLWSLNLNYVMHFNDIHTSAAMFNPYAGIGLGYMNDASGMILGDDGMTWALQLGSEVAFTESLSMNFGSSFFGLWKDLAQTEFSAGLGVTWWINETHGMAIDYDYTFGDKIDYLSLSYLYSWR